MSDKLVPLEYHICFAVYAAGHALNAAYKPLLEPLGLTYPQFLVLLLLWERDGLLVKEISQRLHLDSGTVTPLLKRMETAGLLARRREVADERQVGIHLLDKGKALAKDAKGVSEALLCATGMGMDDIIALHGSLQKLTANLRKGAP